MPAISTLAELNRQARDFWTAETIRMEKRLSDKELRQIAFATISAEMTRGMPAYYQTTLEAALFEAENAQIRFSQHFSRKGGKAKKADALQDLIVTLVGQIPSISLKSLEKKIRAAECDGIIEEVADHKIHFINHKGCSQAASLSGLKHRLTRARKMLAHP